MLLTISPVQAYIINIIYMHIYVTKCVEVDEVQYAISCPSVKLPCVHPKWTWNGMH